MKTLLTFFLFVLCSCTTPQPAPLGSYLITQYAPNGTPVQTWHSTSYTEGDFPGSVSFDVNGKTVTIEGSYQIDRFAP